MPLACLRSIRYLTSFAFLSRSHMNLNSLLLDAATMKMSSQIFPFKFSYRALSSTRLKRIRVSNSDAKALRFSTWPVHPRRGEFVSQERKVRASKSLIEDEEELSDWVNELNTGLHAKRGVHDEVDSESSSRRGRSNDMNRNRQKKAESHDSVGSRRQKRAWLDSDEEEEDDEEEDGDYESDDRQIYSKHKNLERSKISREKSNGSFRRKENRNQRFQRSKPSSLTVSDDEEHMSESDDEQIYSRQKKNFERSKISREKSNGSSRRKENLNQRFQPSKPSSLTVSDDEEHMSESDEEESNEDYADDNDDDFTHKNKALTSENIRSQTSSGDSYLSETRFDQFPISPLSLKAIKEAGFEKMTVVQAATLPVILKGRDVLAKARTGTGKTVAFLVPAIEIISKSPSFDHDQSNRPIIVLVICPTRELACQAASEANKLLKHHPSIGVQVVIGGTKPAQEQKRLQNEPCQILVATPGRLKDHIENTMGFATRLKGVKVLVLDEADRLLDMGFRHAIENIVAAVPKQRQTLLFSATVPPDVRQICHVALKSNHEFINTVEEGSEETHAQVKQMHLVAPLDMHFSLLYALLKEHISDDVDYKVIVFCTTAMMTRLVADLLGELHLNVREIHSRKSQAYRTKISDEFRISKGLILVTSDVSARGVDYPDVTLVAQVGVPSDRQQYIHRLGRTGRKGKEGQGILILAPWEDFFLSTIKDLPISNAPAHLVDIDMKKKVELALSKVEGKNKDSAYQAWLGYYNSRKEVARDKCRLVELANEFSKSMGLPNPPVLNKLVIAKMGLKNVPGLRVK